MSRIDFTPAHTTQIPARASVPRSADSSNVSLRAAVHAAEPARGEHADAGAVGEVRGRGDGRRAVLPARDHGGQVADAALGDLAGVGERLQRLVVEPDPDLAAEDRDRRGHRAVRRARRPRSPAPRAGCPAAAARGR